MSLKAKELRESNPDELKEKLGDLGQELFNLKVQAKTGQLEKSGKISEKKRDIARIKTVMNELNYQEKYPEFFSKLEKN